MLARMRDRLQRWPWLADIGAMAARAPRHEFEQASLRVAIAIVVLGYLVWYDLRNNVDDGRMTEVIAVAVAFTLFSTGILIRIFESGQDSVFRRILGMVADNAATSYCLMRMDEGGAVILGVYLFVTFGNGFRFGRLYLHASQVLGLVGFALVLTFSPYWSKHLPIALGYVIAMVVLPFYVGVLAERINEARKRADEANRAKGRFLANVSHEMRTPLNGVIAMADVLRETRLNDAQREIVDTLGTSAHLLLAQIEDVLDMAKIEAGRVQIENRPFDLGSLLTSTIKVMLPQARYKGLDVRTEIAPESARWFEGDAHHLRQVLLNLLSNAVKFTERGEVVLKVSIVGMQSSVARLRFEVKDTGIGIAPAKQAAIFEPFTQADDSITRIYGGTGLGTTIARQLVMLMGGEIGVQSALGAGSLFWFELPFACAEPAGLDLTAELGSNQRLSAATMGLQQAAKVTKIRGARILVAEDNATNQRVAQMVLESAGHRPTIVDDGEAALDALEQGGFDLALFDLSMPVISGLEALKLYQFTTSKPIPILILSANVTTEVIAECQRAGAAEFIPKPLRPGMLLAAIDAQLAARRSEPAPAPAPPPRAEERPALVVVETPLVDPAVLEDLARISSDPTFVERLLCGFRADAQRIVKSIVDAFARRSYEEVKDAAHALVGGAASVGAVQLAQIAARMEKASHDSLRTRAASWSEEVTAANEATLAALERHIEERRRRIGG
jgi:two-component system, sensor histidine kinase RpfC